MANRSGGSDPSYDGTIAATSAPGAATRERSAGLLGTRLGRYEIVEELGHGGMAAVYRARDPQLSRDVAVKVMHGFLAGRPDIQKRFQREAQAVAALKHEALVEVFDFAPDEGAQPGYIVAELIRGPTLRTVLDRRGKLWPELAALVVARVARGLAAAHGAGIVHRDVKPDNIMIDRPETAARPVVTDFGVAQVSGLETMTATGALVGSPAYMSPEQARGEDVGPASDIFSLGVVLYHLTTGRLPFPGKDPLQVITAILRGELKRPSVVAAAVSPTMERVILRCMRQDPKDRYASAAEIARELEEVLREAGITDEPKAMARAFADPEAWEAEWKPRVAEAAFAAAKTALRRGDFSRALAEANRVFAYAPDHPGATRLLASISSRRRFIGIAKVAGVVVVLAGVAWGAVSAFTRPAAPAVSASAPAPVATRGPSVAPLPVAPAPAPTTEPVASAAPAASPTAPATPRPGGRKLASSKPTASPAVTPPASPNPTPVPVPTASPAPMAAAETRLKVLGNTCAEVRLDNEVLKGGGGITVPVSAGRHELSCTKPLTKVHTFEVPAGRMTTVRLTVSADGSESMLEPVR